MAVEHGPSLEVVEVVGWGAPERIRRMGPEVPQHPHVRNHDHADPDEHRDGEAATAGLVRSVVGARHRFRLSRTFVRRLGDECHGVRHGHGVLCDPQTEGLPANQVRRPRAIGGRVFADGRPRQSSPSL